MENYSYSSYPDSGNSSPRSREIDCENASWDEPLSSSYKVKLMCSYGGKIHPRPHDNQLTYVGGDTKILAVDRNIRFSAFVAKLSIAGEDLDALISVTNDEDLEHMMMEYDRLCRASKPARLRLFLFPVNVPATGFGSGDTKSERQWFVDALNSVQIQPLEVSSPPAAAANPDFLFGLDKGHAPSSAAAKLQDPPTVPPTVPDVFPREARAGSECGSEDRHVTGEPVVSPAEIQRQVHEFQKLNISGHEQAVYHRKSDELNPRAYSGDYYAQKVPDKLPPAQPAVPVTIATAYMQERHMVHGGYQVAGATGQEPSVYLIQTPAGVFQSPVRPVTTQVTVPAYYGMQRVVPDVYREQQVYGGAPPPSVQQQRVGGAYTEAMGMVRQPPQPAVGMAEPGYPPVTYDGAGRQVYYTAAAGGMGPPYQAVPPSAVDVRQMGGALSQESGGKMVAGRPSPTSSVHCPGISHWGNFLKGVVDS
ncbi:hypothetical protein NMG60_11016632, partial [Bertholletia excelsa]